MYYLLRQVASTGVRVNSVNPGVVWTEIWSRSGMSDQETRDYLAQAKVDHGHRIALLTVKAAKKTNEKMPASHQ